MTLSHTFLKHFEPLEDPRPTTHNLLHNLTDILVITILATICGANTWTEIAEFGDAKEEWLTFGAVLYNTKKCYKGWHEKESIK